MRVEGVPAAAVTATAWDMRHTCSGKKFQPVSGGQFKMAKGGQFVLAKGGQFAWVFHFNPIDKIIELYDALVKSEKEKVELMQKILDGKK